MCFVTREENFQSRTITFLCVLTLFLFGGAVSDNGVKYRRPHLRLACIHSRLMCSYMYEYRFLKEWKIRQRGGDNNDGRRLESMYTSYEYRTVTFSEPLRYSGLVREY